MSSQEPKMASQEPESTAQEHVTTTAALTLTSKYTNRVLLKTILERSDGGLGLVGHRVVIGGWVKSSKEVKKDSGPQPQTQVEEGTAASPVATDITCVEILQSRMPFLRAIPLFRPKARISGSGASTAVEKLEPAIPLPPPPSIVYLLISDGSCVPSLQMIVESSIASPSQLLPIGTCVLAEGVLKQSTQEGKHKLIELIVEKVVHIGTADGNKYPLSKKRMPIEVLRDFSHFRPRTTTVASVMRIRSALTFATHTFFQNHGFLCVQMPVITTTDGEGFSKKFQVTTLLDKPENGDDPDATKDAGAVSLDTVKSAIKEKTSRVEELKRSASNKETLDTALQDLHKTNELASQLEAKEKLKSASSVKADYKVDSSEDFFSCRTYLTVSGRLHLESYACALGNVYSFGPRFRAERRLSVKQAAEMWMVEVEMAFSQLEDAMNCADDYFKFLCKWVLENCSEDMKFVTKRIDKASTDRLQSMITYPCMKISYMEAVDILTKVPDRKFETKLEWGIGLTPEHLSYFADEIYKRPIIIYNYPKAVKPFYVCLNDDGKTVAAFDMVVPKVGTIITGSQNEENIDALNTRIKELGLAAEQYEWYLDLHRQGTVKHSGFTLSFDLMVMFTTGLLDIRDVIPFPRNYNKLNN